MNIGVNFFGPKNKLYEDFEGTLEVLKQKGLTSAEICVAFEGGGEPPKELDLQLPPEVLAAMSGGIWNVDVAAEKLETVRAHGLPVLSCHVMVGTLSQPEQLTRLLPRLLEFGQENHISYYVLSPMKSLAAAKPFVPALRQVSDALAQAGITLALHNHEMECIPENGVTGLDYLLEQCPALGLELDVGWAQFAGADPVALMKKHHDRIPLLHFKDIRADACAANRDTCFTAIGEGSIPLAAILAEAENCAIVENGLIIDQDDSPRDILEDLAISAENIRKAGASA